MTHKYNILAIAGSLRKDSFNRRLLQIASSLAPEELTITVYDNLGDIPLFSEDLETGPSKAPRSVVDLWEAAGEADALMFATPEYNQSIPGVLKNTLDWMSRSHPNSVLSEKPVAIMGSAAGHWGTRLAQAALRQTLTATGSFVMPSPQIYIGEIHNIMAEANVAEDLRPLFEPYLNEFHKWIQQTSSNIAAA